MDSIEDGATIRIGFEGCYNGPFGGNRPEDWKVPTYSIKINKKTVQSSWGGLVNEYMQIYEQAAKDIAKIMNERNVSKYVLYNGELLHMHTNKWESCDTIPNDGEAIFKKTLDAYLN